MATTDDKIRSVLENEPMARKFEPYYEHSKEADALTVYFKPDADYSKRLTDHVTLYLSVETNEIVGCRLKGIAAIIYDLPNYVTINHDGVELSFIFLSFRGGAQDEEARQAFNELAKHAGKMILQEA